MTAEQDALRRRALNRSRNVFKSFGALRTYPNRNKKALLCPIGVMAQCAYEAGHKEFVITKAGFLAGGTNKKYAKLLALYCINVSVSVLFEITDSELRNLSTYMTLKEIFKRY